jgi:uncharacterized protein
MDALVQIRKADKNGEILRYANTPLKELGFELDEDVPDVNTVKYLGPTGVLRASHHAIDPKLLKARRPVHAHTKEQNISPDQRAKLETGIWPGAVQWEAGEKLIIKISGHQIILAEFPPLKGAFRSGNNGRHAITFGGQYDSRLVIPTVWISTCLRFDA